MRDLFRRRDRFDWDSWHYVLEALAKTNGGPSHRSAVPRISDTAKSRKDRHER